MSLGFPRSGALARDPIAVQWVGGALVSRLLAARVYVTLFLLAACLSAAENRPTGGQAISLGFVRRVESCSRSTHVQ